MDVLLKNSVRLLSPLWPLCVITNDIRAITWSFTEKTQSTQIEKIYFVSHEQLPNRIEMKANTVEYDL